MATGRTGKGLPGELPGGGGAARAGRFNALTDVTGLEVGHCTLDTPPALTGVTVVLARAGAVAAVDVRGAAPATRETDALRLENLVGEVQAVVLAGSSAYGLSAADGVMAYLEELGLGVSVGDNHVVPVVPAAAVFDLGRGGDFSARADAATGRRAAAAASGGALAEGNAGAGTGAAFAARSLKGGIGTASAAGDEATVGALVVLNALGSAVDPASGTLYGASSLLAGEAEAIGLRGPPSSAELAAWRAGAAAHSGAGARSGAGAGGRAGPAGPLAGQQTVIGVVATDADLSRAETQRLARIAHDGLARAVRPAHTSFDGDAFFALATQHRPLVVSTPGSLQGGSSGAGEALSARPARLVELFELAADCVTRAIVHAVLASPSAAGISCYADVFPSAVSR